MALQQFNSRRLAVGTAGVSHRGSRVALVAHAAANNTAKGFGARPPGPIKDGCPCGSKKYYKECCKPYHQRTQLPLDVSDAVRARFSAVVKKELPYLLSTFHPQFHASHYGTAPGGATEELREDMKKTVEHWAYSNLRIRKVEPGAHEDEQLVTFQYAVLDKRTPELDAAGRPKRKVQVERGTFLRGSDGVWRFADYKLVVVPEAAARISDAALKEQFERDLDQQFANMATAAQQAQQQQQEQQQQEQQEQEQQQQQQGQQQPASTT